MDRISTAQTGRVQQVGVQADFNREGKPKHINAKVAQSPTTNPKAQKLSGILQDVCMKALQGSSELSPLGEVAMHRHASAGCNSSRPSHDIQPAAPTPSSPPTSPESVPAKYGLTENMVFPFTNDEIIYMESATPGGEQIPHDGACVGHTIGFLLNKLREGEAIEACAPSPADKGARMGSISLQKDYLTKFSQMSDEVDGNLNLPPLRACHVDAGLDVNETAHLRDLDSLKEVLHQHRDEGDVTGYSVTAHFVDKNDPDEGSSHTFAVIKEQDGKRLFVFDPGIGLLMFEEGDSKQDIPLEGFVNESRDSAIAYDVLRVSPAR